MAPGAPASSDEVATVAHDGPAARPERTGSDESSRRRKRVERPEIDLDNNIREARATIQRAQAALAQARQQAKADRRKKARLIKKACHLSPADLERIAVLKRCGLAGGEVDAREPHNTAATGADPARAEQSSAASAAGGASSSNSHNAEEDPAAPAAAVLSSGATQAPCDAPAAGDDLLASFPSGEDADVAL